MINDDIQKDIDRFLNYEMNKVEEEEFLKKMDSDQELKDTVLLQQLVVEAQRKKAEEEFVRHIRNRANRRRTGMFRYSLVAASIFIFLGLFLYGNSSRFSTGEILEEEFAAPIWEGSRGSGYASVDEAIINRLVENYSRHNQQDSLAIFYAELKQAGKLDVLTLKSKVLLSYSFIKSGNAGDARPFVEDILDSPYADTGEWLLLGCFLVEGNRDMAMQTALKISEKDNVYSDSAEKILERLERKKWF